MGLDARKKIKLKMTVRQVQDPSNMFKKMHGLIKPVKAGLLDHQIEEISFQQLISVQDSTIPNLINPPVAASNSEAEINQNNTTQAL